MLSQSNLKDQLENVVSLIQFWLTSNRNFEERNFEDVLENELSLSPNEITN